MNAKPEKKFRRNIKSLADLIKDAADKGLLAPKSDYVGV